MCLCVTLPYLLGHHFHNPDRSAAVFTDVLSVIIYVCLCFYMQYVIFFFFLACSFGVIPTTPLAIHTPLMPNQSIDVSLPLNTIGPVMKMDPLNNLQVENEITIQIRAEDYRWLECACGVIVLVINNSI